MSTVTLHAPRRQALRDYQIKAIEDLRACIRRGRRSIVLVSPTGSGKTTIAAAMIESAQSMGKRILFLAHRKELIEQCSHRLDDLGVDHGIIKANHSRRKPWLSVHVCSVPTLVNRENIPAPDLIFIDECHRAPGPSYRKILARYPQAVSVGLSATPCRTDGQGLNANGLFDDMVQCPSVAELTALGYLVPARIFAPSRPDLSEVHIQPGTKDYKPDELARVCDRPTLTGDVVTHWLRLAADRQTVCFAVNVRHSVHLVEAFQAAGVRCEHLDGNTPDKDRTRILRDLADRRIQLVSSVGVLTEGWDSPIVSCAVLARPTKSLGLYLQMAGRILRPYEGKSDALLLDHAGACLEHGFPDDEREWSLDGVRRRPRTSDYDPALAVRMCTECWAAYPSRLDLCPHCGKAYERKIVQPEVVEGTLEEITPDKRPAYTIRHLSKNPKIAELQKIAQERQYRPGWLWHQLKRLREKGELSA